MTLDRMMYLVISEHATGPIIWEVSLDRMTRPAVALELGEGQYDPVLHVLELNPVEGICREVTDDFSQELARCTHHA